MKRLVFIVLLLMQLPARAQHAPPVMVLNMDTLREHTSIALLKNWLFSQEDDPAMADTGYDDSRWPIVKSYMELGDEDSREPKFTGFGWFRLHLMADANMVNTPLALRMEHSGASEIYLDGRRIKEFGYIAGKDSSLYIKPTLSPFVIVLTWPGHHVLAVRYANYDAERNFRKYREDRPGFVVEVGRAGSLLDYSSRTALAVTFILILLFGIFIALGVAHLFLYLYNRSSRSNLFFSIFCTSVSFLFLVPWMNFVASSPSVGLSSYYTLPLLTSAFCFSLSGFVNDLFSKKKQRFTIITILSVVAAICFWIQKGAGLSCYFVLIVVVMLEAIILIIKAMYRKVQGARIIGVGVLLFTVFVLTTSVSATVMQGLSFESDSVSGTVFVVLVSLAVLSLPVSMSLFLAWSFASVNRKLQENLVQVKTLSDRTIAQELEKSRIIESQNEKLEEEVVIRTAEVTAQKEEIEKQHNELKTEKEKSDNLLLNILPEEIAGELKEKGYSAARSFNDVSVIFTDFVDFTKAGERMGPQELVDELHICFKTFDEIISKYGIEKIKTIGDAYLAVGGLPVADPDHAVNAVKAAIDIRAFMHSRKLVLKDKTFDVRIGIHSGGVVAGIVGIKKFAYDIWGDTVNTAARMEQSSEPGKINISESTYSLVQGRFECVFRGKIKAKNKGELNMYFVEPLQVK